MSVSSTADEVMICDDDSCSSEGSTDVNSFNTTRTYDEEIKDGPPLRCWLNLLGGNWVEVDSSSFDDTDDREPQEVSLKHPTSLQQTMPLHQYLPLAARECISAATNKTVYYARLGLVEFVTMSGVLGFPRTSDFGTVGGYSHRFPVFDDSNNSGDITKITLDRETIVRNLPPFSSLTWLDRQLVSEWRTISGDDLKGLVQVQNSLLKRVRPNRARRTRIDKTTDSNAVTSKNDTSIKFLEHDPLERLSDDEDDVEYTRVRSLIPPPLARPKFAQSTHCFLCSASQDRNDLPFSSVRRRHHCRLCGASICRAHGAYTHPLPELLYQPLLPERVCSICKLLLVQKDASERIAWRLCRARDYFQSGGALSPYFTPGLDTVSDAASRLTAITITFSRKFPFGAQTTLAIETINLIRQHGLNFLFSFLLRQEFIQATELLMKVVGIDRERWPISWKEMTLGIFYALAAEKYRRGARPDFEATIHRISAINSDEKTKIEPFGVSSTSVNTSQSVENNLNNAFQHDSSVECNSSCENIRNIITHQQHHQTGNAENPELERVKNASYKVELNEPLSDINGIDTFDNDPLRVRGESPHTLPTVSSFVNSEAACAKPIGVCSPVETSIISSCLLYAPIALSFLYAESEIDLQLLAAQQGWRLLYAHLRPLEYASREMSVSLGPFATKKNAGRTSEITGNMNESDGGMLDKPAYAVLIHEQLRIACWGIRGTASINDLVMDIRAIPIPFPEDSTTEDFTSDEEEGLQFSGDKNGTADAWKILPEASRGMAVCGMARAATNLFHENLPIMEQFWRQGYKIRITGHSLGGGIGALLGVLIIKHWRKKIGVEGENACRVYGFGTPACVDSELSKLSSDFTTTVILHDDVVPRLTPTSIRNLLKHLMLVKQTWVDQHFEHDLTSVFDRARKVWAPRFRGSFMLPRRDTNLKESDQRYQQKSGKIMDFEEKFLRTESSADETLLESSDEEIEDRIHEQICPINNKKGTADSSKKLSSHLTPADSEMKSSNASCSEQYEPTSTLDNVTPLDGVDVSDLLVLNETPLPRMYVPGRIVHIYSESGAYKATFVPRSFKAIRRISLAGNMLTDHTAKAYYEALLEVKSVREACEKGMQCPKWASYEDSSSW